MHFTDFDPAAFLRTHWQKQPLLIRNPWADWRNPLEPDELAGLACEAEVESRLIRHEAGAWTLEHGPFAETRFTELGDRRWTLLVQAVDHHVPEVAALIAPFRFVPNWRIDDVMVTYAVDEGGVGPHVDQYDVFLIQGLGRRRWQVGAPCDAATPLLPHDDLRLLADFQPTRQWVLEPGDILYVPPGVPHNGVALGEDCMTYSVGFRAPSRGELIEDWAAHLVDTLVDDDRYADPDLAPQANPGEIAPAALARLHAMLSGALDDREAFARWFGTHSSTPKYPEASWAPAMPVDAEDVRGFVARGAALVRNPASRFAFIRTGAGVTLFVDGESVECAGETAAFAEQLCAQDRIDHPSDAGTDLIVTLCNRGSIAFDDEDEDD